MNTVISYKLHPMYKHNVELYFTTIPKDIFVLTNKPAIP